MSKNKRKNKKKSSDRKITEPAKAQHTEGKSKSKSGQKASAKNTPTQKATALKNPKHESKKHPEKKTDSKKILTKENKSFSTILEKAIEESQSENGKQTDKIIILGAPVKYLTKKWKSFWRNFNRRMVKLLITVIVLCTIAAGIIGVEAFSHDRVLPRVAISKMDYSFMPISEARNNVANRFENFQQQSFIFQHQDKRIAIPLNDLKVTLLTDKTIEAVPYFQIKRDNYLTLLASTIMDRDIVPFFQKDDQLIFNLLEEKLGLKNQRAKSAKLNITEAGTIIMVPEKEGIIVNQANLSDLQLKLENEIIIKYKEAEWKFRPMEHLDLITFRKNNDQIIITITPELLKSALQEEVFNNAETAVSHLKIFHNEKGEIVFEGRAINGEEVNKEKLINDLEMATNSLDQEVTLEVNKIEATVETDEELQELGVESLLGTGHTTFSGSPSNRRHNIAVGMDRFNGLLIKPGETFSFNTNLGEVDGSTGYKLELVIKAEGTIPEYGGGICQVSSTMYKAGLFSGLPIVDRSPHSYAVSYYAQIDGYGLDSTIYPGVKDLKMLNDTSGHLLIQTFVEGDHAYINFFGTHDGRDVRIENYWQGNWRGAGGTKLIPTKTLPPGVRKQIESAHTGFDASWDRIITKNGEETVEKIYSAYRATSNRILVGEGSPPEA